MAKKIYQCPFCKEYFATLSEFEEDLIKCGEKFDKEMEELRVK